MKSQKLVRAQIIFWSLVFLAGSFLIAWGIQYALVAYNFSTNALHAQGKIEFFVTSKNDRGTNFYSARFSFVDANGKTQHAVSTNAQVNPSQKIGDKVDVVYLPSDPEHAHINTIQELYSPAIGLGLLGMVIALFGLLRLLKYLKYRKNIEWLITNGKKILAGNPQIVRKGALGYGVPSFYKAYVVTAEWVDPTTKQKHLFSSWKNNPPIFADPKKVIGSEVEVFIDVSKPGENYLIDLGQLLNR